MMELEYISLPLLRLEPENECKNIVSHENFRQKDSTQQEMRQCWGIFVIDTHIFRLWM